MVSMLLKKVWLLCIVMSLAGLIALLLFAFFIEPSSFEVTRHEIHGKLNRPNLKIVQLSDLHLKKVGNRERTLVDQVLDLQPDLLVLSGDMIDHAEAMPVLADFLNLLSPIPVVAVPGNWEHWSEVNFSILKTLFETRPNGHFLLNEHWTFTKGGRSILLTGLDDFTAGQPDLRLLDSVAEARSLVDVAVLIQHSPGFFESPDIDRRGNGQRFDLCLSGHTHGGQVSFWGWAPFTPPGSGRFVAGFFDAPMCRLYVSRGLGTSVLPLRLGSKPEIAAFDL